MRRALLLPLALATVACATAVPESAAPLLLRFQPPERGGPIMLPEASPSGVIDLTRPCVALEIRPGHLSTIITTAEARLGRDSKGLYLQYRDRRFRHGSSVKGGGGHYDTIPLGFGPLDAPVPEACSTGPYLIFYGIEPFVPSSLPPQSPPPPGPVLIRYKPATEAGPEVFRMAVVSGTLDFGGQCVRLRDPSGLPRLVVTSAGSQLDWDEQGPFLRSGEDNLRHGDEVQAGGGEIGGRLIPSEIAGDIPTGCEAGPFVEAIGIQRYRPSSGPPDSPLQP